MVTLHRWKLSEKSRSLFCSSQLLIDELIARDFCWSIQGYIKWFRDVLNIGRQKQNTKKQALYAVLDHKHCGLAHDRRTRVAKVRCNFSRHFSLVRCLRCQEPVTVALRDKTLSRIQNTSNNAIMSRHLIFGKFFFIVGRGLDSGKCFVLRTTATTPSIVRRVCMKSDNSYSL